MTADWIRALEADAPDVVAAWRGIETGQPISVRREIRQRAGAGSGDRLLVQLGATAAALIAVVEDLPDDAFGLPGGEADWTVAEAIGHVATARAGLVLASALSASGRWPADAPTVVPGIPGPADGDRGTLVQKLAQSQRVIARSVRQVFGHETDPCLLHHPLVGRLRCGEWVLFAGVHDVMHLEQLHGIAEGPTSSVATAPKPPAAGPVG